MLRIKLKRKIKKMKRMVHNKRIWMMMMKLE
jgi:hypothetical protein